MHLFGDTAFVSNSCKDQMVRLMPMWQERGTRPGHTTMRHYILLLNTVRIVNIVNHCNYLSPPIFACNHLRTWISYPEKGMNACILFQILKLDLDPWGDKIRIITGQHKMFRFTRHLSQLSLSLMLSVKNMSFLLGWTIKINILIE